MPANQNKREIIRKKREAQKRRKLYITIAIVLAAVIFFGLVAMLPKLLTKPIHYESSSGFSMGDPEAPVKVVLFSNYSCGYCKIYSDSLEKDFISDYVETGDVFYQYVNLPYNSDPSLNAAEASYCAADQNKFFDYKSFLYTYASATDGFSTDNLIKYAELAGLDAERFQACLESDEYAQAYLEDRSYAQSAGITGTPTFLVNDQLVGSSELRSTVDSFLSD